MLFKLLPESGFDWEQIRFLKAHKEQAILRMIGFYKFMNPLNTALAQYNKPELKNVVAEYNKQVLALMQRLLPIINDYFKMLVDSNDGRGLPFDEASDKIFERWMPIVESIINLYTKAYNIDKIYDAINKVHINI